MIVVSVPPTALSAALGTATVSMTFPAPWSGRVCWFRPHRSPRCAGRHTESNHRGAAGRTGAAGHRHRPSSVHDHPRPLTSNEFPVNDLGRSRFQDTSSEIAVALRPGLGTRYAGFNLARPGRVRAEAPRPLDPVRPAELVPTHEERELAVGLLGPRRISCDWLGLSGDR